MKTKEIKVGNVVFGSKKIVLIAGPCSVESKEQLSNTLEKIEKVDVIRGGAFKPRTSPYSFLGLGNEGISILKEISNKEGKPFVTEIMDKENIDEFIKDVDIIQVGARDMQNFSLLTALGKIDKPILLKRGFGNTIEELIEAAEYIKKGGNDKIILCERGIRTFENSTRFTLDLSSIAVLKEKVEYPVVVDPSHAAGNNKYVESLALASVAAGADGIMVEVHNNPEQALSDKEQALTPIKYNELVKKIEKVARAIDREI